MRCEVDVDLGQPDRAFQSSNVLLEKLRGQAECYIFSRAEGRRAAVPGQSVTIIQ